MRFPCFRICKYSSPLGSRLSGTVNIRAALDPFPEMLSGRSSAVGLTENVFRTPLAALTQSSFSFEFDDLDFVPALDFQPGYATFFLEFPISHFSFLDVIFHFYTVLSKIEILYYYTPQMCSICVFLQFFLNF